ncbi:hypothetical protein EPO15_15780 [bacterium]|nr:MAG: hypothetical protein EPO15_15780 [bacterium]
MPRLVPLLTAVILLGAAAARAQGGGGGGYGGSDDDSLLGRVRASAVAGVPAIQGVVVTRDVPEAGHNSAHHPSGYNIWAVNCHTQANSFVAQAAGLGLSAGILACDGAAEASPQHHTANWAIIGDGMTCVYNWGSSCCWQGESSPPDTSSGLANKCARWACGDQYNAEKTQAMESGKLIEAPGPQACAIEAAGGPANMLPGAAVTALTERRRTKSDTVSVPASPQLPDGATLTFTPDRLEACHRCCAQRAELWSGNAAASVTKNLADGREDKFRRQCASACRYSFGPEENR